MSLRFFAACLLFLAAAPGGWRAHASEASLRQPVTISLEFLSWIGQDADWLRRQLDARGYGASTTVDERRARASELAPLVFLNRVRTFAHLDFFSSAQPLFDLTLEREAQRVRCVTPFPKEIAGGIASSAFDRAVFPLREDGAWLLPSCLVGDAADAELLALDRDAFRRRFFDASGALSSEHLALNDDPSFAARALDLGFFVSKGDFSGVLTIE